MRIFVLTATYELRVIEKGMHLRDHPIGYLLIIPAIMSVHSLFLLTPYSQSSCDVTQLNKASVFVPI